SKTDYTVPLTSAEKTWLKAHPIIRLAPDPDFPPTEFFDANGNHRGIAADYTDLLQKRLGIQFQIVKLHDWGEVLRKARRREIDVIAAATKTPERSEYLIFTKPYLEFPAVLVAKKGFKGTLDLRNLANKKMSVKAGYAARYYVVTNFPEIKVDIVPSIHAGLRKVSTGTSDAFLENLLTTSYYMEKEQITDLEIAGEAEFMYRMAFAVRSDWPILQGILEKGLDQITPDERQVIYNKWVPLNAQFLLINKRVAPPIFIGVGFILFLILTVFFWNLTLRRQVARRTSELYEELVERTRFEYALQENEEKFRVLAETSPAAILLYQGESLVYVNPAAMKITGFSEQECLKKKFWDWVDVDSQEQVKSYGMLRQKGESVPENYEAKFRTKDGKIKWVLISAGRIQYRGNFAGIASVIDITKLKQAEDELRRINEELEQRVRERTTELNASMEELRFIQYAVEKSSHQAFWVKENGALFYVNDSACHSLEYDRDELIGMSNSKIDPNFEFVNYSQFWNDLRENNSQTFESLHRAKSGRTYPVEVHANFVVFNEREYICCFVRDISERKQAERALRKNELDMRELVAALKQKQGLLNTLIDSIPDLIFYKDTEGIYHGCNKSFESFTGRSKESLIGCTDFDLFPTELAHFFREKDFRVFSKQSVCRNEECVRYPDGQQVLLETIKTPYYDPQGKLLGLIGISRDITRRKEAEEALRKSNEELDLRVKERTAQLTSLTAELSRAEEYERRRIAGDLHDQVAQTLALSKIKLNSLILSGHVKEGDEVLRETVNHLSTSIDEIRSLTFQLSPPILHEVGLEAALEWLCEEFQEKYGLRIRFQSDGKFKPLNEETRAALYRMSRELLVNIVKHAQAKNVHVMVSSISNHIHVCISDDGVGFDSSQILDNGNSNNSFGLLNIHHRMNYLGGNFIIGSVLGHGTNATIIHPFRINGKAH
ncbi:PAS domain S-box protein, partial [bacterium]|nr:PAS domain S-box protein [bacterium]